MQTSALLACTLLSFVMSHQIQHGRGVHWHSGCIARLNNWAVQKRNNAIKVLGSIKAARTRCQ